MGRAKEGAAVSSGRYPVVSPKFDGQFPDRMELRLPDGLRQELQGIAEAQGLSMNAVARKALVAFLDAEEAVTAGA